MRLTSQDGSAETSQNTLHVGAADHFDFVSCLIIFPSPPPAMESPRIAGADDLPSAICIEP